jgi:23S rRNA pseudouridine1911/1915/1917 synthase
LARYPEMQGVGYGSREPGVLHRLDHHTSGLIVAARSQQAFERLRASLSAGHWTKRYLALVAPGVVSSEGIIETALAPDPRNNKKVVVVSAISGKGRPSRTEYRRLRSTANCDLIEISVDRAYRHQIRAHFASVEAPLLGDDLYGGRPTSLSPRHALHASYIACATGTDSFEVEASLPADLASLLGE